MKNTLFFRIILCLLLICSAFYIKYRKDTVSVPAITPANERVREDTDNLTFSDLAGRLSEDLTLNMGY